MSNNVFCGTICQSLLYTSRKNRTRQGREGIKEGKRFIISKCKKRTMDGRKEGRKQSQITGERNWVVISRSIEECHPMRFVGDERFRWTGGCPVIYFFLESTRRCLRKKDEFIGEQSERKIADVFHRHPNKMSVSHFFPHASEAVR